MDIALFCTDRRIAQSGKRAFLPKTALSLGMGKSMASKSLVKGDGRFQFGVSWVRYNAQLLYLRLSCHHEPALKGLLRNWKTKRSSQTRPNSSRAEMSNVET